jgi:hypothetical protein
MRGHGTKFSRRKELAIAALISSRTYAEAASEVGISVRTLLRWLKLPDFRGELLEAKRGVLGSASARLQNGTGAAAATLLKTMVDPDASAATRVTAAKTVISLAQKSFELDDLDTRIARLEGCTKHDNRPVFPAGSSE